MNAGFGTYTENEQLVLLLSTVDLTRSLAKKLFSNTALKGYFFYINNIFYDNYMHLIPY